MDSRPEWQDKWIKKLENVFGMPLTEVDKTLSPDQIIGILRKFETGKDPHEKDRMSYAEEVVSVIGDTTTARRQIYRDAVDETIGISYRIGLYDYPPDKRGHHLTRDEIMKDYENYVARKDKQ